MNSLLEMRHITKKFGDNTACDDVSISVKSGEILALLGENGAGKSTLIKTLAGIHSRDTGDILFKGQKIANATAIRNKDKQPIAFIHQDLGLIDWMTVAENMAFSIGFGGKLLINWRKVNQHAKKALDHIGVSIDPETRIFDLTQTEKALLAIARAIAVDAELLILDEPTASLPADDVRLLFKALGQLKEKGVGMIYVTHRLDEVIEICEEVVIMRDGQLVASGKTTQFCLDDLVSHIVGGKDAGKDHYRLPRPTESDIILLIKDVIVGDTGPVSFSIREGEMLALAGLRGSGHEEVGRMLFGMRKADAGNILLKDKEISNQSPMEAVQNGISMVARNRMTESLVGDMSVQENMFINPVNHGAGYLSFYGKKHELQKTQMKIKQFDIRPAQPNLDISALSGGNQQKVIMARWLDIGTPVLVLEDPTAGVDVGARADIYQLLNEALQLGIAIILISTDFEEIAKVCNRALVFNRGNVVGELVDESVSFTEILQLASQS